jgi:hypothetical protein
MGLLGKNDWWIAAQAARRAYAAGHGRRSNSKERPRGEQITFQVERFQAWYTGEVTLILDEFLAAVTAVAGPVVAEKARERLEAEDDGSDEDEGEGL